MLKYIVQWMKEEGYKYFLIFFVLLAILLFSLSWIKDKKEDNPTPHVIPKETLSTPQVTTGISVVPKEKPSDPDLKVQQKYTAQINNKVVEVPLSPPKEYKFGSSVVVSQSLDVTAAVKPMLPKWSVGVGVGRYHNETYIPVSVTRHYKPLKRSLQFTLKYSVDKRKIAGGEIQHLWNF